MFEVLKPHVVTKDLTCLLGKLNLERNLFFPCRNVNFAFQQDQRKPTDKMTALENRIGCFD